MSVRWGGHSRCKHRLHVLSGIGTGGYRERPDCADMLPARRVPIRIIDREQPNFPKGLQDCASSSLRSFCGLSCRETIQVPEDLVSGELSNGVVRKNPATDLLVTLAHRAANPTMDRLSAASPHNRQARLYSAKSRNIRTPSLRLHSAGWDISCSTLAGTV